jgi:hypothetical protein
VALGEKVFIFHIEISEYSITLNDSEIDSYAKGFLAVREINFTG